MNDHGRGMADGSNVSLFSSKAFTKVGRYQGSWVAIKPINKTSVHITREILKDFKEVNIIARIINQLGLVCSVLIGFFNVSINKPGGRFANWAVLLVLSRI